MESLRLTQRNTNIMDLSNTLNPSSTLSPGVRTSISNFIGDRIQTAYNMGDLTGTVYGHSEFLSSSDGNDFYRFQVQNAGVVRLDLTELDADADLYLLDSTGNILDFSIASGNANEVIIRELLAGSYYIQVRSYDLVDELYSLSFYSGATKLDPGNTLATAHDLGNINYRTCFANDVITSSDRRDLYRFELTDSSEVSLELTNLTSDLELALYDIQGNLIRHSINSGSNPEQITRSLNAGVYYIEVSPYGSSNSSYTLNYRGNTLPFTGTRTLTGTFAADTFDLVGNYRRTVISGNGNLDFGSGLHDRIDLSGFISSNVTISLASSSGGGTVYDPGNGMRVFDTIRFNDGRYILFEGIDSIQFSDRTINLSIQPNDPLFSQQWNLGMMGVQGAWRFTTGSDRVLISVVDTGVSVNSQGLPLSDLRLTWNAGQLNLADDFRSSPGTSSISHGTAVQSIIASASNNGIGMSGINWRSPVAAIDVIGGDLGDLSLTEASAFSRGLADSQGQRLIVNLSLGIDGFNEFGLDPAFEAEVARNPHVLYVISAGNNGHLGIAGLSYPASLAQRFNNVIAVGAAWGREDQFGTPRIPGTRIEYPYFFDWGSQYGAGLTLMAPSEVVARNASPTAADYRSDFNGTSAAAPNVTGVASLLWSANPNLSAAQIQQILAQTAIDLGSPGYDIFNGHGFVNADAAVRRGIAIGAGYA
jgi:serine protease